MKYGNPGTPDGRIRGGLASIAKQIESGGQSPFVARTVRYPKHSADLAEFVGILLGDGCINKNQISISLNIKSDKDYASYVVELTEKLFRYRPSLNIGLIKMSLLSLSPEEI